MPNENGTPHQLLLGLPMLEVEDLVYKPFPMITFNTPEDEVAALYERIIQLSGHDPEDPNIADTPRRVAKALMRTWLSGYSRTPEDVLKTFPNRGNEGAMVIVKDIPFYSMCAHHMAPFFGTAYVAYIPKEKVLGLSKFPRLLDIFARRLQLQERITDQFADAVQEALDPLGVYIVLRNVQHMCMTSRGVQAHGSNTTTSAVRGVFATDAVVRTEALSLMGL